jgi:hypothetical protein
LGQTRVDLQHLLEDIRDAYPGGLEESILTEIVANSLDSGATIVRLETDSAAATLTVIDDGSSMARRQLARYHDIAASTKSRGEGIGFAGVGIKLGILASEDVLTEARRGASHVATSWRLASRHKAPWRWVSPPGLVAVHGTAVRLHLRNPLSPLADGGFIEATLRCHFQPLFDPAFDEMLASHYRGGVRFFVNGREMGRGVGDDVQRAAFSVRLGRKRKPSAAGYLLRASDPLPEERQGLAVSTLGKVIKRGWDWLGFSPAEHDRIAGLIEVPGLAESLTLNKADFIRAGSRGALYLGYRKAIQEAVSNQLAAWGDGRDALEEEARRRKTRPLERDLANVLIEMAEDFPMLASLVDRRPGGQKRLPMGPSSDGPHTQGPAPAALDGLGGPRPRADGAVRGEDASTPPAAEPEAAPSSMADAPPAPQGHVAADLSWPAQRGRRRPTRLGLSIQFESRPEDPCLARLLESTAWINAAHPAYRRAAASRAEGYHVALAVAMALAPLAVEPAEAHGFVTAFLARWGEALNDVAAPRHRRRRGR